MKKLLPFAAAGLVLAACGGVPGNSVATVDGDPIEKTDYDHWTKVVKKLSPGIKNDEVRNQVVSLIVSFRWLDGEAERQGVTVSDAEVKKSFDAQKRQAFPKDADYVKFIRESGQTEEDIRARVRVELLGQKLQAKVVKGKDQVSDKAIADFYAKNKTRFAQPEKRDLRVVLTKGRRDAERAHAALDDGGSWTAVTKKYSIDDTSKASGGKLPAQAKGTLDAALDKAVFGAEQGELVGPVKTQYGYYVFTVTNVVAPSQQSLAEAKETIKQTLASQNQQKALTAFMADFTRRWREKTQCAEGYKTPDCANGPKPTPTPRMQ
ncbi:peptidyl-prolyl cis-trans isomerase [Solirubrobacter sp. CPCC 204708]|uniref:peptidylprolyl isomerase n=1 Tax=Solirubrobacter deserti TaxID=2282478 RepID=A0ABT4RIR3_9ACTN|nr:peptidyl-prolyl cis-trans isomerase [Solirubrobacter deserti]MBE2318851.1 peptidyl-prolyl cis-trans isomerase [Solirubrobacter deserti]MDA0138231.1 peptidyl-prolyl cis-trans isomerase [Solirubrobacter deserti]